MASKRFVSAQDLIIDIAQIAYVRPNEASLDVTITTIQGYCLRATPWNLDSLRKAVRDDELNARNGRCSAFGFCVAVPPQEAAKYADFNVAAFLAADSEGNIKFCPANQIATLGSDGFVACDINARIDSTAKASNFFIGFHGPFYDAREGV